MVYLPDFTGLPVPVDRKKGQPFLIYATGLQLLCCNEPEAILLADTPAFAQTGSSYLSIAEGSARASAK